MSNTRHNNSRGRGELDKQMKTLLSSHRGHVDSGPGAGLYGETMFHFAPLKSIGPGEGVQTVTQAKMPLAAR